MRRQRGDLTRQVLTVPAAGSAPMTTANVAVLAKSLAADNAD